MLQVFAFKCDHTDAGCVGCKSSSEVMCHRFPLNPQAEHQLWLSFYIFLPGYEDLSAHAHDYHFVT